MIGKQRTWLRACRPDSSTGPPHRRRDRRYRRLAVERIEDRLLLAAGPSAEGGFIEIDSLRLYATGSAGSVVVSHADHSVDSSADLTVTWDGSPAAPAGNRHSSSTPSEPFSPQNAGMRSFGPDKPSTAIYRGPQIDVTGTAQGGLIDVTDPANEQFVVIDHDTSPGIPGEKDIVSREPGARAADETVEEAGLADRFGPRGSAARLVRGAASGGKETSLGRDAVSAVTLTGLDGSRGRFRAFEVAAWDGRTRAGAEAAVPVRPVGFSAVPFSRLDSYGAATISPGFSPSGEVPGAAGPQASRARLAEAVSAVARLRVEASDDGAGRTVSAAHDAVFAELARPFQDFSDSAVYLGKDRRIGAAAAVLVATMAGPTVLRWRRSRGRWIGWALFWRPETD